MFDQLTAMQVVLPGADPLSLPAPPIIFLFLLYLTFSLHMIAMNFTVGGSIFLTINSFRKSENLKKLSKFLQFFLPISMAFTITLGVAPLLFVQVLYGQILFTTSILMAWIWLFLLAALMVAYYGLYFHQLKHRESTLARKWAPLVSTLLLLLIALIFLMNFKMFFRAEEWKSIYHSAASGFFLNLTHPQVWPSMVHYLLAIMAFAGLLVILHGWAKRKVDEDYSRWAIKFGGTLFIVHTALQFLAGTWMLLVLPRELMLTFMFRQTYPTALLFTGMGLAVLAIITMFWAIRKRSYGFPLVLTMIFSIVIIGSMSLVRGYVRDYFISGFLDLGSFEVAPQWDTMILFAVLLVAGLATVGWMISQIVKGGKPGEVNAGT